EGEARRGGGKPPAPLPVAAVQMHARLADIPYNIAQAGDLAEQALKNGARIVALPEFFTTQIVYDERLFACSLPPQNPALDMMQSLAQKYEAMIGGSYLEWREGEVFNTYVLVEADGRVHRHDKDQPTMVENAFYQAGCDDGLVQTGLGAVGLAVCWETVRTRSASRLKGCTDLLMTGSHWWTEPGWKAMRPLLDWFHTYNTGYMARTPALFARMVGAPSLHAAHCGPIEGKFLLTSRWAVENRSHLMGETQIIDREGTLVAQRGQDEGPGFVTASLEIGRCPQREAVPDRFWIDKMPLAFRGLWWHQNAVGAAVYRRAQQEGRLQPFDFTRNAPL
ncbi:MAG: carbon-nitrogen hydrolase family protein, partial [Pseudomonadota bacterium]